MELKTSLLRDAIVCALLAGSAGLVLPAHAQDAPASSATATDLDRVSVTGSRIATPGLTTNSPVTSIERDDFLRTQPAAVEEFVKQLPSVLPSIGPGTNNGTTGAAEIDLRGLGSNRTLVLIDGRRPVPYNLSGVVDSNTIPLALLQSVDVLTGGASVVYGADAISGVANFILRRDFEGAELTTSYGQSNRGDGGRQRTELTLGSNLADGRGNVVLSMGYTKVDPVFQGDRPWSQVSRSSVSGNPEGSATAVPSVILGPPGGFGTPDDDGVLDGFGQIDPVTGAIVPDVNSYNFNPLNYYQTGLDRYQATALGRFEITPNAEVYSQLNYTRSRVDSSLAPSGLFFEDFQVPVGNPFIPEPARQQLCLAYGIAAAECVAGNPTLLTDPGTGGGLTIARRLTELGARRSDYDTKTFQATVGLRGDLGDRWNYDMFWSHGESEQTQELINWGSLSSVRQALLAVDPTACLDPSNGCVPLNVWGPDGSITQEMLDFINLSSLSLQKVEQQNAAFNIAGDLGDFSSPWSDLPIGVAAGLEYRRAEASTRSDAASQIAGEVMGTGAPTPDRSGSFDLQEAYAEVIVPLISNVPGVYSLSLEGGYRHTQFSASGGADEDYGSYKYGLEWAPIESLRFRGMFQRATRAPGINELFAPLVTGLDNLSVDPCGGGAVNRADANTPGTLANLCRETGVPLASIGSLQQPSAGQVNVLGGGNPQLRPELADTQTLGLVWTPTNDFAVTLDYWKIEMEDVISSPSVDDIIAGCYSTELNPGLTFNETCELVGRSPITGTFNGTSSPGIFQALTNQGRLTRTGVDLGARYALGLEDWGRLTFSLDATRVTRNRFQATPVSVDRDCLGYYSVSCSPNSKLRSALRTTWNIEDFTASLAWRYSSSMEVEPASGTWFEAYRNIPSFSYFDLSFAYDAPFNAQINLSVNNLTDKRPPIVGNTIGATAENSGNTFPTYYDAIGRFITLGVTFRFD